MSSITTVVSICFEYQEPLAQLKTISPFFPPKIVLHNREKQFIIKALGKQESNILLDFFLSQQQCHYDGQQSLAAEQAPFLGHFCQSFLFEWQCLITTSQKGLSQVQSEELKRGAKEPSFYYDCFSVYDVPAIYLLQRRKLQEGGERCWLTDSAFILFLKAH